METALDIALEKKDPKKRLERRRKKQQARTGTSRSNEVAKKDEPAESRYVAPEVLERVHERDSYQCVFRGRDGRRCTARAGLQIDHSDPFFTVYLWDRASFPVPDNSDLKTDNRLL